MACEADGDGALTMEILKEVSGGKPVFFGDLSYINEETSTLYLSNCGAMCAWYAARSDDARENLLQIELIPSFRPTGGATVFFRAAPGPTTLARLYRKAGAYTMAIIPGQAIEPTAEEVETFVKARGSHQLPTAFVKVEMDFDQLIAEFGSNHISGVAGDVVGELVHVCSLLGVTPVVIGEGVAQA
jgi:L-fucose isomerase